MTPTPYVLPVEMIYRALSQPKPQETKPTHEDEETEKIVTRADVDAIIHRKRTATPEELQEIIVRAQDFKLTEGERNQIGLDLTIAMAVRARQVNGRREDANLSFIHHTLGLLVTPHGMIERQWFETLLRSNVDAIARCRNHRPPRCQCWSGAREALWHAAQTQGDKSPQAWTALRVWEILEDLELSSRPEQGPGIV